MEFITSLDARILESLYAARDPALVQMFIWLTELGSKVVVGGLTLVMILVFVLRKRFAELIGLITSVAGVAATVFILKNTVQRARPDEAFQAYLETGFAFPSGHAALALALYGFLVWLLWRSAQTTFQKYATTASAILIIGGVGFSRLYLGLHWMSDVVAGFLIAGAFVWAGVIVVKKLSERRLFSENSR